MYCLVWVCFEPGYEKFAGVGWCDRRLFWHTSLKRFARDYLHNKERIRQTKQIPVASFFVEFVFGVGCAVSSVRAGSVEGRRFETISRRLPWALGKCHCSRRAQH